MKSHTAQDDPKQMTFFPTLDVTMTGPGKYTVTQGKPSFECRPATFARLVGSSVRTVYDWISNGTIHDDEYRRAGGKLDAKGKVIKDGKIIWIFATALERLRNVRKN